MLHGLCFGEEPEHDTVCFLFKVSAAGEERYLVCGAGAAGVVSCANCSSYVVLQRFSVWWRAKKRSCVCTSMRFLKLLLQIALEWLHECCMGYILGRKREQETL